MSRTITVHLDGYGSSVSGYGSRELVESVTGRPPLWARRTRGWSVQEHTARNVIALGEERGYLVLLAGPGAQGVIQTNWKTDTHVFQTFTKEKSLDVDHPDIGQLPDVGKLAELDLFGEAS